MTLIFSLLNPSGLLVPPLSPTPPLPSHPQSLLPLLPKCLLFQEDSSLLCQTPSSVALITKNLLNLALLLRRARPLPLPLPASSPPYPVISPHLLPPLSLSQKFGPPRHRRIPPRSSAPSSELASPTPSLSSFHSPSPSSSSNPLTVHTFFPPPSLSVPPLLSLWPTFLLLLPPRLSFLAFRSSSPFYKTLTMFLPVNFSSPSPLLLACIILPFLLTQSLALLLPPCSFPRLTRRSTHSFPF